MEIYDLKVVDNSAAIKALEKAKEEEKKTKLYMRRISPTTTVYCKNE